MMDALITLENVSFKRHARPILQNVSLTIPRGKITAIMGPSGSGKTTLLKLIGAQLRPETGMITVDNQNIHALNQNQLFAARRNIGMLFQNGALFTNINVFENIAFPLREHTKLNEAMIRDVVLMKLQMVGLRGAHSLMPSELSGGMARRVALARAIALDPQLIMYDEPFTGQDPISLGVLTQLIKATNDAMGLTSIIVSHDVKETSAIADYIYVIADAQIKGAGTPSEILVDETPAVKQFIQGLPDGEVPFHYPAPSLAKDLLR